MKNIVEESYKKNLITRFLRYVSIDTQSDEEAAAQPSTAKQLDLARLLVKELEDLGANVHFDEEHGYVYASLPAVNDDRPALGFISHMDTSPACSGANVKPRIIKNYDGHDEILRTEEFPELLHHIGEELIATDGTTLLGADDKAGDAEIMEMLTWYAEHPDVPRRTICVAFTPDEEIGRGTEHFNEKLFGAKEAYTVDGGKLGCIEYECFNAAGAVLTVDGKSVHTGSARNTMLNACTMAMEFQSLLPALERPESTEGYEGFYHLDQMEGTVEKATLKYIIRDHDRSHFEKRKQLMQSAVDYMNEKYSTNPANLSGEDLFHLEMKDQYYNMAEVMKDHMELVDRAKAALKELGVEPVTDPIRGGTDGAALSFRGIPCPNLCTGGYNYHSRFEYASIPEMEKVLEMLVLLAGRVPSYDRR